MSEVLQALYDIVVIGGGASGMMAALSAAKTAPALRIAVVERMSRVGKKLMATGNGRCNLTNTQAGETDYHGDVAFMRPAMTAFPPAKVMERFAELGVYPCEEYGGRVYPLSDQASSVLDVLRSSMQEAGIEEICDFEACAITIVKAGYRLTAKDNRQLLARRVICSAGGMTAPTLGGSSSGYKLLESCGHRLTPRFPALVQLKTDPTLVKPLKGMKYTGEIDILINDRICRSERGEVLFTEYGLSGPAVMQVSRAASQAFAQKKPGRIEAQLHLLPMSRDEALSLLRQRRKLHPQRPLENFLTGMINKRVGQCLVKQCADLPLSEACAALTDEQLGSLASLLTGWRLEITGTQSFEQAQVTAGGVATQDINPSTMESRLADGLYITGEILDIDGDCGGFNLQWAWASGMLAGQSCARSLIRRDAPAPSGAKPAVRTAAPVRRSTADRPTQNARRQTHSANPQNAAKATKTAKGTKAAKSTKAIKAVKGMNTSHD